MPTVPIPANQTLALSAFADSAFLDTTSVAGLYEIARETDRAVDMWGGVVSSISNKTRRVKAE